MADIKLQLYRGEDGPDKVDFRKSTGQFQGSPIDEHKTVLEVRIDPSKLPVGVTLDSLMELAAKANEGLALFSNVEPAIVGNILTDLGVEGTGPLKLAIRFYDND